MNVLNEFIHMLQLFVAVFLIIFLMISGIRMIKYPESSPEGIKSVIYTLCCGVAAMILMEVFKWIVRAALA